MKRIGENYERANVKAQPFSFQVGRKIKELVEKNNATYGVLEVKLGLAANSLGRFVNLKAKVGAVKMNMDDLKELAHYFGYKSLADFIADCEEAT